MKRYRVTYERDESGWWVAAVRGVRCSHTQGRTVDEARRRLWRWEERGRIHPRWARQWRTILEQPTEVIADVLAADTERSRALRQSSPFAGALTEHERRAVLAGVEQATR